MNEKLKLITMTMNGTTMRAVEHPDHGHLVVAADLVQGLGYSKRGTTDVLDKAGIPQTERLKLRTESLAVSETMRGSLRGGPVFLTRRGVNLVLMHSGKPIAQETRQWLAGDVMPAIADTGGYLLNEAARDTAKADDRGTLQAGTAIDHLGSDNPLIQRQF